MSQVDFPNNSFTQMIEAAAEANRSGVHGAGVASASPLPTVRSASLGQEVPVPLTLEEQMKLDQLAHDAGVKDERITVEQTGFYGSLEEALAAGKSVNPPPAQGDPTLVARGAAYRQQSTAFPRVPDFTRIEGIDLVHGRAIVDGMDFPITDEEVRRLRRFVVETAQTYIQTKLQEAMGLFSTPTTAEDANGGKEGATAASTVQQQSSGSSTESPRRTRRRSGNKPSPDSTSV